ncbi:hypothetical protein SAMN05216403_1292 [Nitrosospira multiformis ATCC 25196]|uniref:Uncharacterized protein n=1 Tax=Nitrosospira multiformis (strain ATCC 25196 / NCIMB 11849 / C 71) TaxID=323848 RepID=A0A1H5XBZ8_NITMU|nr:hypothetical protein SAMN05216403_1292 [Nitrosospira multiformis ATCC 25196]
MNGQEHTNGNSVTVTPSPFRFHQLLPRGTNSFLLVLNNHSRLRFLLVFSSPSSVPFALEAPRSAVTGGAGGRIGARADRSTDILHSFCTRGGRRARC